LTWKSGRLRTVATRNSGNGLAARGVHSKDKRRKRMKPSTKDRMEGYLHKIKGKAKEKAGQVTNNPNLAAEGRKENRTGEVQKKVGQIERVFEK
jgi:uncharacterized protein YjbJ (UPF0337 family)